MHVIDLFATFYSREKLVLANIAKIKRSRIKDGLQYIDFSLPNKSLTRLLSDILFSP